MSTRRQNRSGTFRRKRLAHWLRDYVILSLIPIILKSGYDLLCFVFWDSTLSLTSMVLLLLPSVIIFMCGETLFDLVGLDVKRAIRKANDGVLKWVAVMATVFVMVGTLLQIVVWIAYQNTSSLDCRVIYLVLGFVFGSLLLASISQWFMGGLEFESAPTRIRQGGNNA